MSLIIAPTLDCSRLLCARTRPLPLLFLLLSLLLFLLQFLHCFSLHNLQIPNRFHSSITRVRRQKLPHFPGERKGIGVILELPQPLKLVHFCHLLLPLGNQIWTDLLSNPFHHRWLLQLLLPLVQMERQLAHSAMTFLLHIILWFFLHIVLLTCGTFDQFFLRLHTLDNCGLAVILRPLQCLLQVDKFYERRDNLDHIFDEVGNALDLKILRGVVVRSSIHLHPDTRSLQWVVRRELG
ncbi:hypothetical protein PMAYCL1PPCAC_31560, partial [Pristionchus mayeri]